MCVSSVNSPPEKVIILIVMIFLAAAKFCLQCELWEYFKSRACGFWVAECTTRVK